MPWHTLHVIIRSNYATETKYIHTGKIYGTILLLALMNALDSMSSNHDAPNWNNVAKVGWLICLWKAWATIPTRYVVTCFEFPVWQEDSNVVVVTLGRALLPDIHPGRLTWNLTITQLKRKIIFRTIIFRFHVNLPGCITCDAHFSPSSF